MLKVKLIILAVTIALWGAAPAYSQEKIQGGASLNLQPKSTPFYFPWFPMTAHEELKGKWLVVKMQQPSEGAFQVVDLWFQDYDTGDMAVVDKIMGRIPPAQLGSHQFLLSQRGPSGMVEAQDIFRHRQTIIFENFTGPTIHHVATETELSGEILVKIPIEKFDLTQPIRAQVRHLATGNVKDLPIPAELLNALIGPPQEPHASNSPTPWWLSALESLWIGTAEAAHDTPLCDNLQVVEGMSNNAASPGRLNLIFVGFGYSTEETQTIAKGIMGALFYQKPFDMNQQAFNAWVAPGNFPVPEENGEGDRCNCVYGIKLWTCDLEQRAVISLCRKECTSNASLYLQDGKIDLSVPKWSTATANEKTTAKNRWHHEFGHLFGGFRDEYHNSENDDPGFPNCADSKTEAAVWWGNEFPKLQFFKGCSYTEDNYRFYDHSYMNNPALVDADYGNMHRTIFCMQLAKIAGTMAGPYCESIGTPGESACNDGIDNDQDGYTDCDDSQCDMIDGCPTSTEGNCDDWVDNDQDGKVDCQDPDCGVKSYCEPQKESSCSDGLDNDGDQIKYLIGLISPKKGDSATKADKMETEVIEWQAHNGKAMIGSMQETAAQWCAELHPQAPHAKEPYLMSWAEASYASKLNAVFKMVTWSNGLPNPYYQKSDSYQVKIYECHGEAGLDCSDSDCANGPSCQFSDEPVCEKSETKCKVWKSATDWEFVDLGDVNCFNLDDDEGDGAADCLDIECQNHDYSTQPSYFGSTSPCQGIDWKDRVLIKQKGPPDKSELYENYSPYGESACEERGMICDHLEVKVTNQSDGWFDVMVDEAFQKPDGSYVGCDSFQSAFMNLPEGAGNFAFRAVCVPGKLY